jgi:hypothetical protein
MRKFYPYAIKDVRVCGYYETKTDSREKTFGETPRYCIQQHLLQTFVTLVFIVLCSFVVNTTCVDISFSFRKVSSRTYILLVVSSMLSAQAEHCLMPVDMFLLDHQSTKLSYFSSHHRVTLANPITAHIPYTHKNRVLLQFAHQ